MEKLGSNEASIKNKKSNILREINNKIFDCLTKNANLDKKNTLLHLFLYIKFLLIDKILKKEDARYRSNQELKKIASLFEGNIVNVSAWLDMDKQGQRYKEYFKNATAYETTNHKGDCGYNGESKDQNLNLEDELSPEMYQKYDVVFNHTTLEHVPNIDKALENICKLSKDIVILVVPYIQDFHHKETFGDYHRFTPSGITKKLNNNGYEIIYLKTNESVLNMRNNTPIYDFVVASKNPEQWKEKISNNYVVDKQHESLLIKDKEPYIEGNEKLQYL